MNPSVLIMFSGGLDSTGVFWKLINTDKELHIHHLHLVNVENRAKAEEESVKKIIDFMKKIREFSYSESRHEYPVYGKCFMWDSDIYNFVAGAICLMLDSIKEVAVGRTKSDIGVESRSKQANKILQSFNPNIKKIYPVGDMTKQQIYDMLPLELRNLTWSCRRPIYENGIKNCRRCKSCKEIFKIRKKYEI